MQLYGDLLLDIEVENRLTDTYGIENIRTTSETLVAKL